MQEHSTFVQDEEGKHSNLICPEKHKKHFIKKSQYFLFAALLLCNEWGDKSQFSAIALAANYGVYSIILGGALVRSLPMLIL